MSYVRTHLNFTTNLESCQLGQRLTPPTPRSLAIAIRPQQDKEKPILRFHFPLSLMERAGFVIGDHATAMIDDYASHIKIVLDSSGNVIHPAANNPGCQDYYEAENGTVFAARLNMTIPDDVMEKFKFGGICMTFVEPTRIQRRGYIIVPIDTIPITAVQVKN